MGMRCYIDKLDKNMGEKCCLIIVFWGLFSYLALGQPRINNTTSYYQVISSGKIVRLPVGWCYNDRTGKWSGYYGAIDSEYRNNHRTPKKLTPDDLSAFNDCDIFSLQVKKVKSKNKEYYLLYHRYWNGEFDYPSIQRGWRYWKDCKVYIIEDDEFEKFLNPKIGISKIHILDYATPYDLGELKGDNTLNSNLNTMFKEISECTPDNPYNSYWSNYCIYIKLEDDGKTLRFRLPTDKMLWVDAQVINKQNEKKKEKDPYFFYTEIDKYNCIDFDSEYFELSPAQYTLLKIR